ncbi:MAG: T9SS type A sorting domain-containing protein [Saprospiraceae bacterium]|nr:T9SS type A sorting domain-containing protein [Saprospiraceae bacterium]
MKRNLLGIMLIALGSYVWFGNASGPGKVQNTDRTGSPLSPGFCNACHSGGSFGTEVSLLLVDINNDTIAEYIPANTYTLKVSIAASGAEGYGFQTVPLTSSDMAAGTFGSPAAGTQITNIGGASYFEHSNRSGTSKFEIEWTAPEAGTGVVTFYAAGNAVNANSDPSGDNSDTTSLTIVESLSSGLRDQIGEALQFEVFPSPAQLEITTKWSLESKAERISINDLTGKTYYTASIKSQSLSVLNIRVDELPSGIYFVRLLTEQGFQSQKFVKI